MASPRVPAALALLTAALLLAGCSGQSEDPRVISTQGTGIVTGSPDTVTIVLGVETRASDASTALTDNAERARSLIETIKAQGVEEEDIATKNLSVQPNSLPSGSIAPAAPIMAMARAWRRVGFNRLLPLSESSRCDMLKLPK